MGKPRVQFRVHALKRLFQRGISSEAVLHVLQTGVTLEKYPQDLPYPSRLVLGWWESQPLHVVVAENMEEEVSVIVTAYRPDPMEWETGFRKRRKP